MDILLFSSFSFFIGLFIVWLVFGLLVSWFVGLLELMISGPPDRPIYLVRKDTRFIPPPNSFGMRGCLRDVLRHVLRGGLWMSCAMVARWVA